MLNERKFSTGRKINKKQNFEKWKRWRFPDFLCLFLKRTLWSDKIWINKMSIGFLPCSSFCSQSTPLCLLSLLHCSTLSSTKKRRVSGRQRKKRFYCVNYLEVKAGWDSTVLYRQERVILMSGEAGGYFSSYLLLLLCLNTPASSCSHRKLWAPKTGSNLNSRCRTSPTWSNTVTYISPLLLEQESKNQLGGDVVVCVLCWSHNKISLPLCLVSYMPQNLLEGWRMDWTDVSTKHATVKTLLFVFQYVFLSTLTMSSP